MRLKNILLVVRDAQKSKAFYKELFGLEVVADFGENVVLTGGLVLQEQKLWEETIGQAVVAGGNAGALYFEEYELDKFIEKLEHSEWEITYLHQPVVNVAGQRAIRIYDLDKHIIEISEK